MTDRWFLPANDDTAAASTHPVRGKERLCVTPLNRHKRSVSYTVQMSITGGEGRRGREERNQRQSNHAGGKFSQQSGARRLHIFSREKIKSHSGRVLSRWSPEGRRKTEVDQGQIRSPLTIILPDNTVRNWAHSAARENSRVTGGGRQHEGGWRDEWRTGEKVSIKQSLEEEESVMSSHADFRLTVLVSLLYF